VISPMRETLARLHEDDEMDPMALILATSLATVTVDLDERDQWDAGPRLCVVERAQRGDDLALRISELRIPRPPDGVNPVVILDTVAESVETIDVPAGDIVGWLFVVEAWCLTGFDCEGMEKVAQERLIHADPESVECRVAILVDRAGRIYQTLTVRGSDDEPTMMVTGPGGNSVADGRVLEALQHLMDVTPVST
jgi:hypothetical protein